MGDIPLIYSNITAITNQASRINVELVMLRKILFTIIFTALFVFVMWFGINVLRPLPQGYYGEPEVTEVDDTALIDTIDFTSPTPEPLNSTPATVSLKQTGWIPTWAFNSGFKTLQDNYKYFDSVSPVWYHLNDEGLITADRRGLDELIQFRNNYSVKIIPSIASFSADQVAEAIRDPISRQEHLDYIVSEIEKYNLDGIDIDYESIYAQDKPEFLSFIRELYTYLDDRGKSLTIAVIAEFTDNDNTFGFRQTTEALDLNELGMTSHEIRIMSYNLTGSKSSYPGPISPIDWKEAIARYALTKSASEKIFIGIAQYGYDGWSKNPEVVEPYLGYANPPASKAQVDAVTYNDVMSKRAPFRTSMYIDEISKEKVMEYTVEGKNYIVFFTDSESHKYSVDLANHMQIGGLAHWRLGSEDSNVYSLIDD